MTVKQRKYIKYVAQGMNKNKALEKAEYAHQTNVASVEKSPDVKKGLLKAMERIGITDDFIAKGIYEGTKATRTLFYTNNGIVSDKRVIKDFDIRHKYIKLSAEIRGDLINDPSVNMNLGLIMLPERETENTNNTNNTNIIQTEQNNA